MEVAPKAEAPAPTPEPQLERRDVILAALDAASAAALGRNDREAQAGLRGRRFELKVRFGCGGPTPPSADGWSYDAGKKVLRVRVSADVGAETLKRSDLIGQDHEGEVGFTLRHPLLLDAGCPAPELALADESPAITIVQLFTSADSRVQRPRRSYEMTLATNPGDVPTDGLDLVLEGRLEPLTDQRPIHCGAESGRLACIISAKLDRVSIEDPARKALIGEWIGG